MRQRERIRDATPSLPSDPAPDRLDELRAAAQQMRGAGADIIERVLSGDSLKFLRANQQAGGQ